jgi:hypothetical protein
MYEPIKIDIQYTSKDIFLNYFKYYFDASTIFYSFLGFYVFANTLVILFYDFEFINLFKLFIFNIIFTLSWLFILLCISLKNSTSRQNTFEFVFSEDSLEYFNEHYKSKINWTYFVSAKESFGFIDLVMHHQQKISIPIRNIDPIQLVEIRKLIKSQLGERARLKESSNKLGLR